VTAVRSCEIIILCKWLSLHCKDETSRNLVPARKRGVRTKCHGTKWYTKKWPAANFPCDIFCPVELCPGFRKRRACLFRLSLPVYSGRLLVEVWFFLLLASQSRCKSGDQVFQTAIWRCHRETVRNIRQSHLQSMHSLYVSNMKICHWTHTVL